MIRTKYGTIVVVGLFLAASSPTWADPPTPDQVLDNRCEWTDWDQPDTAALQAQLTREIEAIVAADDHLAPVNIARGIGGRAQMWGNPADTVSTLCAAAPLLDDDLAARAIEHARMLIERYPPWRVGWEVDGVRRELWPVPPELTPSADGDTYTGPLPGNLYALWQYVDASGDTELIEQNWQAINALGQGLTPAPRVQGVQINSWERVNCFDRDVFVNVPGVAHMGPGSVELKIRLGSDPELIETFTDDRRGNLIGDLGGTGTVDYAAGTMSVTLGQTPPGTYRQMHGFTGGDRDATVREFRRLAYQLRGQMLGARTYARVAGLIGYARLAEAIDADEADDARRAALAAIGEAMQRGYAAMYKYGWDKFGHTRTHDWMYTPFHQRRDNQQRTSTVYCPEILQILAQTDADAVSEHVNGYIEDANMRAWFLYYGSMPADGINTSAERGTPGGERLGGENSVLPPDLGWSFYVLQAHVMDADPADLRMWIDIPYARVGDLHHIERILAGLRAHGQVSWQPIEQ